MDDVFLIENEWEEYWKFPWEQMENPDGEEEQDNEEEEPNDQGNGAENTSGIGPSIEPMQ
jgi:hypothetical protein